MVEAIKKKGGLFTAPLFDEKKKLLTELVTNCPNSPNFGRDGSPYSSWRQMAAPPPPPDLLCFTTTTTIPDYNIPGSPSSSLLIDPHMFTGHQNRFQTLLVLQRPEAANPPSAALSRLPCHAADLVHAVNNTWVHIASRSGEQGCRQLR